MSEFKLLLVEDNEKEAKVYMDTLKVYQKEKERIVYVVPVANVERAREELNHSFDGAIIDLKLAEKADDGNLVIQEIRQKFRIPIIVLTGTPKNVDTDIENISVYTKGERDVFRKILDELFLIYDTGITRIFGGRGLIESAIDEIFWKNVSPKMNVWKDYVKIDRDATEKALYRNVMNHLHELSDIDNNHYYPEEMYIYPPIYAGYKTGSIVKSNDQVKYYIVLSPECDLALRADGEFKTEEILLCEIDPFSPIKEVVLNCISQRRKRKKALEKLLKNNYNTYYHWLASTSFFAGGVINFRKITAFTKVELEEKFDKPIIQVSAPFVKDIVARFSTYYARQGQPDFCYEKLADQLV